MSKQRSGTVENGELMVTMRVVASQKPEPRCLDELLHARAGWLHSFDFEAAGRRAKTGAEGAPDAWLEIELHVADALLGMQVGHELHGSQLIGLGGMFVIVSIRRGCPTKKR